MKHVLGQPLNHLVTPVQRTEPVEDIDSDRQTKCIYCNERPMHPEYSPYCEDCAVIAELDE